MPGDKEDSDISALEKTFVELGKAFCEKHLLAFQVLAEGVVESISDVNINE